MYEIFGKEGQYLRICWLDAGNRIYGFNYDEKAIVKRVFCVGLCEQAEWSALYGKLASQGEKD